MNFELVADAAQAATVPCPAPPLGCSAPVGDPCIRPRDGKPLVHLPAHTARLKAAGVVHAPLDSRYLRNPERSTW